MKNFPGICHVKPSLLELVVNARISAFGMSLEIMLDRFGSKEFDRHRIEAWMYAEQAGYLYPGRQLPAMLDGVYELADAWRCGQARYKEETSLVWLCEEEGFLSGWYSLR